MSHAAAGICTHSSPLPALKTPRAAARLVRAAGRRGAEAVEPHDLIPIRIAPHVVLTAGSGRGAAGPELNRVAILLEPVQRPGQVLDLENHLDLTGEILLPPASVEDDFHHITRGMVARELHERREERVDAAGPDRLVRAGFGFS